MALLAMQDVSVGFGGPPLLENMNFQIETGERICLIGRNGAGKSTLMKLICGQIECESGTISKMPGLKVASLEQDVPEGLSGTVFDQVADGFGEQGELLARYHDVSHRIATEGDNKGLLNQLDKLQHALDTNDGWQLNRQVESILEKMKLDADAEFASLSAGMKRRVLLAKALVMAPDILLLDEPTNHLDIDAITWMEEFLGRFSGTLMFVSHDRAFLKKLATRIIEVDRGRLASYSCDYETYVKRKEAALQAESVQRAEFDRKLAEEEVWIRKGIQARRTRNEGRVRELIKMRDERRERKEVAGAVTMQLQNAKMSGRLVAEAKDISFGYGDKCIISGLNTTIMRGDKIGIIGPNGSGKTTLLKVLLKELQVTEGNIRHGVNLEIAYFDQLHAQLDEEKSVFENVADGNHTITVNGVSRPVLGYLQDFLFTPAQSRNPVANLSGGERNRLLLARLFTHPSNLLVLDEPTNDLDIETLDLLEEFLANYPGTVLMVSHDREFLNNVVTSTLVMEGDGEVGEYVGGYDDWLWQRKSSEPAEVEPEVKAVKKVKVKEAGPRKLTFKEKKELEGLPGVIEKLEAEQGKLHESMASPEFYKDGAKVVTVTAKLKELDDKLKIAYARWEELDELS